MRQGIEHGLRSSDDLDVCLSVCLWGCGAHPLGYDTLSSPVVDVGEGMVVPNFDYRLAAHPTLTHDGLVCRV